MDRRSEVYTLLERLVHEWPADARPNDAHAAAQAWLKAHEQPAPQTLARETLESLDALLRALQGGVAMDRLLDAREALTRYIQREPPRQESLTVKLSPAGGVTLLRGGQHLTIDDSDLDQVREAITVRKREVRKRQRREQT
jgi:hypothetical protein